MLPPLGLIAVLLGAAALCSPVARAQGASTPASRISGVVPKSFDDRFGDRSELRPLAWEPMRFQQVFLGSELPNDYAIHGVAFRWEEHSYFGYPAPTIDVEIRLGYTTKYHRNVSTTFAANFDVQTPAPVVVFPRQQFKLPDVRSNRRMEPGDWHVRFPFSKVFDWKPQPHQNLLIEIVVYGNNWSNMAFTYFLDAVSYQNTSMVFGAPGGAEGTLMHGAGLVMNFHQRLSSFDTFGESCPGTGGWLVHALPKQAATAMGDSTDTYGVGRANQRYQQVFDNADIGTMKIFSGHALRMGSASHPGGKQTLEIKLSPTTYSSATITNDFSTNVTGPVTTVFNKKTYDYPPMTPNADPAQFRIAFKWDVPSYFWAGTAGENLLVDIVNTSAADLPYPVDAWTVSAATSRVFGPATSATGTVQRQSGLTMGFFLPGYRNHVPALTAVGHSTLGSQLTLQLERAKEDSAAVLLLGGSDRAWGPLPLPWELSPLGAPGCRLLVSPEHLLAVPVSSLGTASTPLPIPSESRLLGHVFYVQYAVLDPTANDLGLVFTNGGRATIGG